MEPAWGGGKLEISDVLRIYFLLPFGCLTTPTEENIDRDHRKSRKGVPSQLQFFLLTQLQKDYETEARHKKDLRKS